MADDQALSFSISNTTSGDTIASGTLQMNASGTADAISGSIYGVAIDGLSSFDSPDDQLIEDGFSGFRSGGGYEIQTNYGVDASGISFTAGGISYNISYAGTIGSESFIEKGAVLTGSDGSLVSTTFVSSQTSYVAICFAGGTLIRTARGDIAVEALRVGDLAVTASGALRPIGWLGHRTMRPAEHAVPSDVWPVRVLAGAFGPGLPVRDLMLSPGHPVLIGADADREGGHLVPIMCLINGTTIARAKVDAVTYWHIELDAHDILLAEGLPAESYIDLGSRPWFAGADGALYDPDMALPGMPGRCRPVAIDGPVVEAERQRLDAMFAMRLASACAWPSVEDASLPL